MARQSEFSPLPQDDEAPQTEESSSSSSGDDASPLVPARRAGASSRRRRALLPVCKAVAAVGAAVVLFTGATSAWNGWQLRSAAAAESSLADTGGDGTRGRAMDVDGALVRKKGKTDPGLLEDSEAPLFTFYMYRAQRDSDYPPESVNMATLPGVLWYLHNEITSHCPRRFDITRILRYKVTTKTTKPLYDLGMNFGVRYAFDSGVCTGPWNCQRDSFERFGYIVGCNDLENDRFPFPTWQVKYPGAIWYSVPGKCPSQKYDRKSNWCVNREPGGICEGPATGKGDCTFSYEPAGDIRIDDVVGIKNDDSLHHGFCNRGCQEYSFGWDGGRCTDFWNRKRDVARNMVRIDAFRDAFKRKYPDMPDDRELPPPKCDFNRKRFYEGTRRNDFQEDSDDEVMRLTRPLSAPVQDSNRTFNIDFGL